MYDVIEKRNEKKLKSYRTAPTVNKKGNEKSKKKKCSKESRRAKSKGH